MTKTCQHERNDEDRKKKQVCGVAIGDRLCRKLSENRCKWYQLGNCCLFRCTRGKKMKLIN